MKKFLFVIVFLILYPSLLSLANDYWNKSNGPFGGCIVNIIEFGGDSIIAASSNCIYLSTNKGNLWKRFTLSGKTIYDVSLESDGRLYASCVGGLWVSPDHGRNWNLIPGGIINGANYKKSRIGAGGEILSIAHISHQYNKLYRRDNGTGNWSMISMPNQLNITLAVKPSNGIFFIGSFGEGIFRSTDGGLTFSDRGLDTNTVYSIYIDSRGNVYAGTKDNGLFKSTDNGLTWNNLTRQIKDVKSILVAGDTIFVGTETNGVYRSTNNGADWQQINNGMINKNITVLQKLSWGGIFCGSNAAGVYSLGSNSVWEDISKGIEELPVNDILKLNDNNLLISTSGKGLYLTTDKGSSWEPLNTGLSTSNIYRFDKSANGYLYGVATTGEVYLSTNTGANWTALTASSSFSAYGSIGVNPANNHVYYYNMSNRINRSTDNGASWEIVGPESAIVKDFAFARNGNVIAATYNIGIIYSTDNGENWLTASSTDSDYFTLAVDSTGVMYAGNYDGRLEKSTNNGVNWQGIRQFNSTIDALAVNSLGDIFAGTRSNGVYVSKDRGLNFQELSSGMRYLNTYALCTFDTVLNFVSSFDGIYLSDVLPIHLDKVTLRLPANQSDKQLMNPILKWDAVENAAEYKYIIAKDELFTDIVENATVSATATQVQNTLDDGTIYYWKVQAKKEIYVGEWSDTWSFSTSLKSPELINPLYSEKDVSTSPQFKWSKIDKAEGYRLRLSKDSIFTNIEIEIPVWSISHVIEGLEANTKYYWCVRAEKGAMKSDWSDVWSFTTGAEVPVLILPENLAGNQKTDVNLLWKRTKNASFYIYEVCEKDDFLNSDIVACDTLGQDTSCVVGLKYSTKYYWRVRAVVGDILSKWSEIRSFTTGKQSPMQISPDSCSQNHDRNVKLVWSECTQFDNYEVLVSENIGFNNIAIRKVTSETFFDIANLNYEAKYYWKVRGKTDTDSTLWSNTWCLIIGKKPPVAKNPLNNSEELANPVEFSWERYTNANKYELQLSLTNDFSVIYKYYTDITDMKFITNDLEICTDYFWRIRAFVNGTPTLWSEPQKFSTGLQAPALVSPENQSVNIKNSDVLFSWQPVTGTDFYSFKISKDSDFSSIYYFCDSIFTTNHLVKSLSAENKLYWCVKSNGLECNSKWSETYSFTVQSGNGVFQNDTEQNFNFSLFPNPAMNEVTLLIDNTEPCPLTFEIYSMHGTKMDEQNLNVNNSGKSMINIYLSNYSTGIYQIVLSNGYISKSKRLIIVK